MYLATRHLGWGPHLFALRLTSYLLAWLALALGAYATIRWADVGARRTDGTSVALGVALWPLLFPSWFPEMARLGNDSLCALIMAGIWWLTARTLRASCSVGYAATVGILLGLGALTKALFIPVAVGLGAFWCVRRAREGHRALGRTLAASSLAFLLATAIAAWWYVGNWRQYGEPLGSLEMILLRQAGGLVTGLSDRFSLLAWVRGHAAAVTTFAWSGTWSHARPPYLLLAPLAAVVLITAGAYVAALPRFRPSALAWLPVFIATPVLAGLSYHVLVRIALTGEGRGTGGYYLHFLAAPLGVALGLGFDAWSRSCAFRKVLGASLVYVLVFSVVISWAQVMLWSGWFFKAGASNFYQVPAHLPPLLGLPDALHRLEALAFPGSGAAAWIVGGLLLLSGLLAGLSSIGRVRIG